MSMDLLVRLPDPEEIKKKYPASEKVKEIKAQRDKEIADVFTGKSNKFLLIKRNFLLTKQQGYATIGLKRYIKGFEGKK